MAAARPSVYHTLPEGTGMRQVIGGALGLGILVTAACNRPAPEAASQPAAAPDPAAKLLLESFGEAVAARNYTGAYEAVATEARGSLTFQEFEEAVRPYRDSLPDDVRTSVVVDPPDKETTLLVPESLRDHVVAEGIVDFSPGGEGEGFSINVWVVRESGQPKVAGIFVGD